MRSFNLSMFAGAALCVLVAAPASAQTAAPNPIGTPDTRPADGEQDAGAVKARTTSSKEACATPRYPLSAKRAEHEGTVKMSFLIGVDGRVIDSKLVKSSGDRELDLAAKLALATCVFTPMEVDGKAVEIWAPVSYVWSLR